MCVRAMRCGAVHRVEDIVVWLEDKSLPCLAVMFKENQLNGTDIFEVSVEDFEHCSIPDTERALFTQIVEDSEF